MKFVIYMPIICLSLLSSSYVWAVSEDTRPEYQKEYDAYLEDLSVIAQTGKAPYNSILESDLAKMSSNDKIMLTAPKPNDDLRLAQNDNAEIMDSVEIINIPEEFRKDYGYVQEENKTISTQSIVDADNLAKRELAKNSNKNVDHVNPFRLLKESPLSAQSESEDISSDVKNPMVNAYFNQFGRPFVANKPENTQQGGISKARAGNLGAKDSVQSTLFQNEEKKEEKGTRLGTVKNQSSKKVVTSNKRKEVRTSTRSHSPRNVVKRSKSVGLRDSMFVD